MKREFCAFMDRSGGGEGEPCKLGETSTSDVVVWLKNKEGRPELFYSHSSILVSQSKLFAELISNCESSKSIEIHCTESNYDHHFNLLRLLYLPVDLVLDSLESVKSAVGILEVSVALSCEEITKCCIQYLEAVPWEDKEEVIIKAVSRLGPIAMPILARIQQVEFTATKDVFISAFRFVTSVGSSSPPFGDELKTSSATLESASTK